MLFMILLDKECPMTWGCVWEAMALVSALKHIDMSRISDVLTKYWHTSFRYSPSVCNAIPSASHACIAPANACAMGLPHVSTILAHMQSTDLPAVFITSQASYTSSKSGILDPQNHTSVSQNNWCRHSNMIDIMSWSMYGNRGAVVWSFFVKYTYIRILSREIMYEDAVCVWRMWQRRSKMRMKSWKRKATQKREKEQQEWERNRGIIKKEVKRGSLKPNPRKMSPT